jgi:NADPH:quinone reductase-like Zn-dependent oxidoreductase
MATDVNPVDITTIAGGMSHVISLPAVLGTDVSGIIDSIGDNVRDFKVGEAVMDMINYPGSDGTANGHGYGMYAQTPANQVIKKIPGISFE